MITTPKRNGDSDFYETFQHSPCSRSFLDRNSNLLRQLSLAKFCVNNELCRNNENFDLAVYDAIHLLESTYNRNGKNLLERIDRTNAFKTILYQSPGIECYVSFFEALVKANCVSEYNKKAITQIDFFNKNLFMTETQRRRLANCFSSLKVHKNFCDDVFEKEDFVKKHYIQVSMSIDKTFVVSITKAFKSCFML